MTDPCPPPDWDNEDAVLAYVLMELEHGHDQSQRHLTDREADWQQYGQPAAELFDPADHRDPRRFAR